jgi:hypothetical protein
VIAEIARELLATRAPGKRVLLVGGPAIVHTGAGKYSNALIRDGYVDALYAGNALAVHDIESQFFGTSLGVDLDDAFPVEEGHVHHLRTVNRIRAAGGIAGDRLGLAARRHHVRGLRSGIPVVLAGSIRDDGPLPDVITDVVEAQRAMRRHVPADRHGADGLHAAALDRGRQPAARLVQDDLRRHQSGQRDEADRPRHDIRRSAS